MAMVKTAFSMPKALFDEVNEAANELRVSRSQLIVQALRAFLRQRENDRLLAQLNDAWADGLDEEDEEFLRWASYHALRLAERLEAEE